MKKNMVFLATACALSLTVTQSYAGFEWRGPAAKTQGFSVESAPISPVETIDAKQDSGATQHATPESTSAQSRASAPQQLHGQADPIKWNQTGAAEQAAPQSPAFDPAAEDDIGNIIRNLDSQSDSQASAEAPAADDEGGYYGFGQDMPMVMAMEQILPQGYNPAFARNVNMGQRMSWNGDGNWQSTLRKGLKDLGLDFYLEGRNVYIVKDDSTPDRVAGSPAPTGISAEPLPEDTSDSWLPENWAPPHSADTAKPSSVETANQDMMPQQISKSSYRQADSKPVQEVRNVTTPRGQSFSYNDTSMDAPKNISGKWSATADETLRETLQKWAVQNGSSLEWTIDYDYLLKRPVNYDGSFSEAVKALLDQFSEVEPRPYGQLFKGKQDGYVLRIKAYGVE